MKITHTTYDATRGGRPTRLSRSASQRVKNYFSGWIHHPSQSDEEALTQSNPKTRGWRVSEAYPKGEPRIYSLMGEHKELKRKPREKKIPGTCMIRAEKESERAIEGSQNQRYGEKSSRTGKLSYVRMEDLQSSLKAVCSTLEENLVSINNGATSSPQTLTKKNCYENLKSAQEPTKVKGEGQGDVYMNRLRRQDPSECKAAHRKSSSKSASNFPSTPNKLGSYMVASADLLDATRRDLTANLRKRAEKVLLGKFDYLGRYAPGHGNDWGDDSDSDESFNCIGERRFSDLERGRRLSSDGTDPWTCGLQKECRLCRKPSPAGVRGLCEECENEFRRPKTIYHPDDDNIEPPTSLMEKVEKMAKAYSYVISSKPRLATTGSRISHQGDIEYGPHVPEIGSGYVSEYEEGQSPDLYEIQDNESSRWSLNLLDGDKFSTSRLSLRSNFNKARNLSDTDEDLSHLISRDDEQGSKPRKSIYPQRNSSFYGYWDEIFKDQPKNTTLLKKRGGRSKKF